MCSYSSLTTKYMFNTLQVQLPPTLWNSNSLSLPFRGVPILYPVKLILASHFLSFFYYPSSKLSSLYNQSINRSNMSYLNSRDTRIQSCQKLHKIDKPKTAAANVLYTGTKKTKLSNTSRNYCLLLTFPSSLLYTNVASNYLLKPPFSCPHSFI